MRERKRRCVALPSRIFWNADMAMYEAKVDGKASIRTSSRECIVECSTVLSSPASSVRLLTGRSSSRLPADRRARLRPDGGRRGALRWQHPTRLRLAPGHFDRSGRGDGPDRPRWACGARDGVREARPVADGVPGRSVSLSGKRQRHRWLLRNQKYTAGRVQPRLQDRWHRRPGWHQDRRYHRDRDLPRRHPHNQIRQREHEYLLGASCPR